MIRRGKYIDRRHLIKHDNHVVSNRALHLFQGASDPALCSIPTGHRESTSWIRGPFARVWACSSWPLGSYLAAVLTSSSTILSRRFATYYSNLELQLSPTSKSFAMWRDTPIPITIDFYFFNWTNSEELLEDNFKPNLTELGPYRFKEVHEKVNLTWNTNGTITFRQVRRWYFDPENSNGTLKDNVTTLNVVSLIPLSSALRMTGQQVWVTKTIGELLFEGYSDPILTMAAKMPQLAQTDIPVDKFGWFYMRNGSADFEGVFNMETGTQDISKVGKLSNWNYGNRTRFYEAECGMVNGSAGELFPPGQSRNSPIEMFSSDLCRSISFDYAEDTEVHGISGYKYVLGKKLVDNGTIDPGNWCNCGGECIPQGAINVSSCRHGAPAFVSYPHYLDADSFYADKMYSDVPTIFFPMMWFEERATMSEELASDLRLLLMIPSMMLYISVGLIVLGCVLFGIGVLPKVYRSNHWTLPHLSKRKKAEEKSTQIVYTKEQIRPLMTQPDKVSAYPEGNSLIDNGVK
ncbi:hypothetical protein C0J52_15658 [Blattella germanica]|nr:hypothetical protein C0J52_15658 [Blattella germanica]